MFIGSVLCFIISYIAVDSLRELVPLDIEYYYEMLFWSSTYMLQFIYMQLFMLTVLTAVQKWKGGELFFSDVYEMLLCLNFVLSMSVFLGHYKYDIESTAFKDFYILYTLYLIGIVPTITAVILFFELKEKWMSILRLR